MAEILITSVGKRDWAVRRENGEYLGVITEMEAVEGSPFYVTSVERHDAPAHGAFESAMAIFDVL